MVQTRRLQWLGIASAAACFLVSGCSSSRTVDLIRTELRSDLANGRIQEARIDSNALHGSVQRGEHAEWNMPEADDSADSVELNEDQALLWYAERGHLDMIDGEWSRAVDLLDDAAWWMEQRRIRSLGADIGKWFTNDTIQPYYGRGYETIQIGYWRWLSHVLMAQSLAEQHHNASHLITTAGYQPRPGPSPDAIPYDRDWHHQRAINLALAITSTDLGEVSDFPDGRFADDPAARMLLATTPWLIDRPLSSDVHLASVQLREAWRGYQQLASQYQHDDFRLEARSAPQMLTRLLVRHARQHQPGSMHLLLQELGMGQAQADAVPDLPRDHGMLLVLDHVGLVTVPQPLVIRIVIGAGDPELSLSDSERDAGVTISNRQFGLVVIWAKGPGSQVIDTWAALPLPHDFAEQVAPGGIAVMGAVLPAHRPDTPIGPPAHIAAAAVADSPADQVTTPVSWRPLGQLEVFWDLDAYARAALVDYQPSVLLRTLLRATGKQAGIARAAHDAREDGNETLAFLLNLFGSAVMTLTEDADIRAWSTLPDHVAGGLYDLPAGRHHIRMNGSIDLGEVEIRPGQITVIPVHRPAAPIGNPGLEAGFQKRGQ